MLELFQKALWALAVGFTVALWLLLVGGGLHLPDALAPFLMPGHLLYARVAGRPGHGIAGYRWLAGGMALSAVIFSVPVFTLEVIILRRRRRERG
jgi:hypothetical protein